MDYTSQPESAGEPVTMVTGKVVLCDNDTQIVGFMFFLFGVSRGEESRLPVRQLASLEDPVLKIVIQRWLGRDGKPRGPNHSYTHNQLTKKSANCRLPSSVMSSPVDRESVRTRHVWVHAAHEGAPNPPTLHGNGTSLSAWYDCSTDTHQSSSTS